MRSVVKQVINSALQMLGLIKILRSDTYASLTAATLELERCSSHVRHLQISNIRLLNDLHAVSESEQLLRVKLEEAEQRERLLVLSTSELQQRLDNAAGMSKWEQHGDREEALPPYSNKAVHTLLNRWQSALSAKGRLEGKMLTALNSVPDDISRVFLFGDSIFRGYAAGRFDLDFDDPLKELNHPDLIYNLLAEANNSNKRAFYSQNALDNMTRVISELSRDDDWFVFQDAGLHSGNALAHFYYLRSVGCLISSRNARSLILTNFSAHPACAQFRHDTVLSNGQTINDAVRAAVAASATPGSPQLLDIEKLFVALRPWLKENFNLEILSEDGIHLTYFGNLALTFALLRATNVVVRDFGKLPQLLNDNWPVIASGAPWKPGTIEDLWNMVHRVSTDSDAYSNLTVQIKVTNSVNADRAAVIHPTVADVPSLPH